LSDLFGKKIEGLKGLDPLALNLILSVMVAAATEVTSNVSTANILMPIMFQTVSIVIVIIIIYIIIIIIIIVDVIIIIASSS
jgi:di/tricarboxylate transporter